MRAALLTVVLVAVAVAAAPAWAIQEDANVVANPSAEDGGLVGWTGSWQRVPYGTGFPRPFEHFGPSFFGAPSGSLTQTVDVPGRAWADVDAGRQPLQFGAGLGGFAGTDDTAYLRVRPLAADGTPLAEPIEIGGPNLADRGNAARLLQCWGGFTALPPQTRRVRFELDATGPLGAADQVLAVWGWMARPAIAYRMVAKGCEQAFPTAAPPPGPPAAPAPPPRAQPAPSLAPALVTSARLVRSGRGLAVRYTLSAPSDVHITTRRCTPRCRTVRFFHASSRRGTTTASVVVRASGTYQVVVRPPGGAARTATRTVP